MSDLLDQIHQLRLARKDDKLAPHKPLLLLIALGRVHRGEDRLVRFGMIRQKLTRLLKEHGTAKQPAPEYPFWHLRKDHLWEIPSEAGLRRRAQRDRPPEDRIPRMDALVDAEGGFPEPIFNELLHHPEQIAAAAAIILREHFPPSQHDAILAEVGLGSMDELAVIATQRAGAHMHLVLRRARDPIFRRDVLTLWEHRCAICSFDACLDGQSLGVEAAHVKWHCYDGPDSVDNGLALCSLHHVAFDKGAFTFDREGKVRLSPRLSGGEMVETILKRHCEVRDPPGFQISEEFRHWHAEEVFKAA